MVEKNGSESHALSNSCEYQKYLVLVQHNDNNLIF